MEVKCTDVLNCRLRGSLLLLLLTSHPSWPSSLAPCSVHRPAGQGSRVVCSHQGTEAVVSPVLRRDSERNGLCSLLASSATLEDVRVWRFLGVSGRVGGR